MKTEKRILLALLIAMLAAGGAFAEDFKFSAGVGGLYAADFGGGVKQKYSSGKESTFDIPYSGTGFYAFVDAMYAEAFISFFNPTGEISTTYDGKKSAVWYNSSGNSIYNFEYSMMTFGILGKFPIAINDMFTIFPAVGIDYRTVSEIKSGNSKIPKADMDGKYDALWILGGVGLDFNLLPLVNVPIYIRLEALYGIRLENELEKDMIKKTKDAYSEADISSILGHGLTAKLAVGWKF